MSNKADSFSFVVQPPNNQKSFVAKDNCPFEHAGTSALRSYRIAPDTPPKIVIKMTEVQQAEADAKEARVSKPAKRFFYLLPILTFSL